VLSTPNLTRGYFVRSSSWGKSFHGWPIATLYSMRSKRLYVAGFLSSSILASAHFVSSIIIVVVFVLVSTLIEVPQAYLQYGAAIELGILAIIFCKEKPEYCVKTQHGHLHNDDFDLSYSASHKHEHWHKDISYHSHEHIHKIIKSPSLKSMTSLAFILGLRMKKNS
jgi:ABC-type nickel/cobalt efflux system permease component RcnA